MPQLAAAATPANVRFGIDLFSVRSSGWTAFQHLDYCAKWKAKVVHFSEIRFMGSLEPDHLKKVRAHAAALGIEIELGMRSICPTSKAFDPAQGTAEQQLTKMIDSAKLVGSPIVRCFLGSMADRGNGKPGSPTIEQNMENTVTVLKAVRSRALEAGIKIAVENHAGDMQARELVTLIEAAGRDYVGANLDSGNACWTMEDPLRNLEILGPYVLTTSLRDSMIWEYEKGVAVQWTAMGEGIVDFKSFFEHFIRVCPNAPVHIETISGFTRRLALFENEFWTHWPKMEARDLARFMALAKKGKAIPEFRAPNPQAGQEYQKGEIERSIAYCKNTLGLGRRM